MKTERLCSPAFGSVKILNQNTLSKELKTAIKSSKAIKTLGRRYNASLSVMQFGSATDINKSYYGFSVDNIKPKNIFVQLLDFLRGRKCPHYAHLISKHTDETGFINNVNNMKKNTFIKVLSKKD